MTRYRTFGAGYDAKASTAICMDKVQEILDTALASANGKPVQQVAADIQAAQLWTALAQVHATALLALATEELAAPKKTCRCIRD